MANNFSTNDDRKALSKHLWCGSRTPERFHELFGFSYEELPKHYELKGDGRVYCTPYMLRLRRADDAQVSRNWEALGCSNH